MAKPKNKSSSPRRDAIAEFEALGDEEAEAVYRSVDREFKLSETRPLTKAQRLAFERGRGRPVVGKGAQTVAFTMERDLLKRVDAFRKARKLKRSELIAAGVRAVMEHPELLKRKGAA